MLTTSPVRLAIRAVVTPEVDRVVMRCLERQHMDRFQTAVELATALDEVLPAVLAASSSASFKLAAANTTTGSCGSCISSGPSLTCRGGGRARSVM